MSRNSAKSKLNRQGRLVIPAACREAAGIEPGDELFVEVVGDGELRLINKRQAVRRAQAVLDGKLPADRDPVAELIAERRIEADAER